MMNLCDKVLVWLVYSWNARVGNKSILLIVIVLRALWLNWFEDLGCVIEKLLWELRA